MSELASEHYHLEDIDPNMSYEVGMIAAPILDANGKATAALALSGFAPELAGAEVGRLASRLCVIARLTSKRSGGRLPNDDVAVLVADSGETAGH